MPISKKKADILKGSIASADITQKALGGAKKFII